MQNRHEARAAEEVRRDRGARERRPIDNQHAMAGITQQRGQAASSNSRADDNDVVVRTGEHVSKPLTRKVVREGRHPLPRRRLAALHLGKEANQVVAPSLMQTAPAAARTSAPAQSLRTRPGRLLVSY